MEVLMNRVANIDVSENTLKQIVNGIVNGLGVAEQDFYSHSRNYANFVGQSNLNYIFDAIDKETSDCKIYKREWGSFGYEFPLIHDIKSKSIIVIASKYRIEGIIKLLQRNEHVSSFIYCLAALNSGYEGDCQQLEMNFDDSLDDNRKNKCDTLLNNIADVDKFILIEYDIRHRSFQLINAKATLYSCNFVHLGSKNLSMFIDADYSLKQGISNDERLEEKEKLSNIKEQVSNLAIKLKNT